MIAPSQEKCIQKALPDSNSQTGLNHHYPESVTGLQAALMFAVQEQQKDAY